MMKKPQNKIRKQIRVIVATHKAYRMPADPMYLPVQVGAEGRESLGYQPDNTGDNISSRNAGYCELTGLYWAWKNLEADYIGLAHYRRLFASPGRSFSRKILTLAETEQLLQYSDVILPKKRNYWVETNYSQYAHAHHAADLDTVREILQEMWPEYVAAYDSVMRRTTGHRFNMFIMKRNVLDAYCSWLFAVLSALEERLDTSDYSENDRRVYGFVAERLLDVWLERQEQAYIEIPYIFTEKQNWIIKGARFLGRKFAGEHAARKEKKT